jgi:hypothetical protein
VERPGLVEILSRDGDVVARVRLDRLPATIGRAYDCDVLLDDPYVAPQHARLQLDGSGVLEAVDLGSRNGLIDAATGERQARMSIDGNTVLRLGRTLVRVRGPGSAVPPERVDRGHRWIERWPYAAGAALLVAAYGVYEAWVSAFGPRAPATTYLLTPLGLLALLLVWSGAWALASRLFVRHAHFTAHLSVAGTGLLALIAIDLLGDQLAFALGARGIGAAAHLLALVAVGGLVFAHLALIRPLRLRRMALAAAALTAAAIGLDMFRSYQGRGTLVDAPFMASLSHPRLRLVHPGPLEGLLQRAAALKPDIDRLRSDRGGGDDAEDDD